MDMDKFKATRHKICLVGKAVGVNHCIDSYSEKPSSIDRCSLSRFITPGKGNGCSKYSVG